MGTTQSSVDDDQTKINGLPDITSLKKYVPRLKTESKMNMIILGLRKSDSICKMSNMWVRTSEFSLLSPHRLKLSFRIRNFGFTSKSIGFLSFKEELCEMTVESVSLVYDFEFFFVILFYFLLC
jgi:hypothetical protein